MTTDLANELLANRVEHYLSRRYPYVGLTVLTTGLMGDEQMLARALFDVRKASKWPNPDTIGEARCASCHRLMHDEPSACADEEVCAKCARIATA